MSVITNIQYSNLFQQELYLLPVFQKDKQLYIYTQNYFYSKWNEIHKSDYVEFILPLENIEIIEILNSSSNNIIDLDIREIFIYSDQEKSFNKLERIIRVKCNACKKEKVNNA